MACSDRDKAVFGINELSEIVDVSPTDLFIVEASEGTNTIKFEDLNIDLGQAAFEADFNKQTTDIAQLSSEVDNRQNYSEYPVQVSDLRSQVDNLKNLIEYASQVSDTVISGGDNDLIYVPSELNDIFEERDDPYNILISNYINTEYSASNVRGAWVNISISTKQSVEFEGKVEVEYPDKKWQPLYIYKSDGPSRQQDESHEVSVYMPIVKDQGSINMRIIGGGNNQIKVKIIGFRLLILNEVVVTQPTIPQPGTANPDEPVIVVPPKLVTDFKPLSEMSWVSVGNANNSADDRRAGTELQRQYGSVGYVFDIGKYAVREKEVDEYNKVNPALIIGDPSFKRGGNHPITKVSVRDALQYVNWLNNIEGFPPAYKISAIRFKDERAQKWAPEDPGYDSANEYRNKLSRYFLATDDEWYKAAYYSGVGRIYYPFASDGAYLWNIFSVDTDGTYDVTRLLRDENGFTIANIPPYLPAGSASTAKGIGFVGSALNANAGPDPVPVDKCGELSHYETQGQSGNVRELAQSAELSFAFTSVWGGDWRRNYTQMTPYGNSDVKDTLTSADDIGFRLVKIPGRIPNQSIINIGFPPYEPPLESSIISFLDIKNANNSNDDTGYGGVSYNFKISRFATSESAFKQYNNDPGNASLKLPLDNSKGDQHPVQSSWVYAARFINWMNKIYNSTPAYKFEEGTGIDDVPVEWVSGDVGYDANNKIRNKSAKYWLPSEDEWYKAAFYDPGNTSQPPQYWDYAFGLDTVPAAVASGTAANTAVFDQPTNQGPVDVTNAGGLSPYGTMGQTGNTYELLESLYDNGGGRVRRGGYWSSRVPSDLSVNTRKDVDMKKSLGGYGFRVASKI